MNEKLEKLQNELQGMKTKLMDLNLRSAMLNIDLVSLHSPNTEKRLAEENNICNQCFKNCEERLNKDNIKKNISLIKLVVKETEE